MSNYLLDQTFEKKSLLEKGDYENCTFKICDLSAQDLSSIKFTDCTFISCNLSNCKLAKTSFQDTRFIECKMLGLLFDTCNEFNLSFSFEQCQLNHSSFYGCKIKKTSFVNCQLLQVDFAEADLTQALFDSCNLELATFDRTILEKADLSTSYNYFIHPEKNRIKKAHFSLSGLPGLLQQYDIKIVK